MPTPIQTKLLNRGGGPPSFNVPFQGITNMANYPPPFLIIQGNENCNSRGDHHVINLVTNHLLLQAASQRVLLFKGISRVFIKGRPIEIARIMGGRYQAW